MWKPAPRKKGKCPTKEWHLQETVQRYGVIPGFIQVLETRKTTKGVRRRLCCRNCGFRFTLRGEIRT